MKTYCPDVVHFHGLRVLYAAIGCILAGYIFDAFLNMDIIFIYLIFISYTGIEFLLYLHRRHLFFIAHQRLKTYGMAVTWLQRKDLHASYTPDTLLSLCESKLLSKDWRDCLVSIFEHSKLQCVYDTYIEPNRLRWSFHISFPTTWSDEDCIAGYFVIMSCLPDNQPWRLFSEDLRVFKIETYMYELHDCNNLSSLSECPQTSLYFWSTFQNDSIWLLGKKWSFDKPVFTKGLVDYIWFELPAKFLLDNEAYISVYEEDDKLYATVYNVDNIAGETKCYANEQEFWFVWRHAIREPA